MELREFAERVLFATTLEEKLRSPGAPGDELPGRALDAPDAPGRPAGLRFKAAGAAKAEIPSAGRLEDERERGRLLHFFANHELLATELMALVLLRFPEAPGEFRRGVLRTLQDEQEHTRLYLRRMGECGVEFGQFPVSGFFWRCVAPMESPIDFVAGLSLTFEQANLDFARHFAGEFAQAGDEASAKLLERIHRDEISHVAHGLKWFRRWKDPRLTDWDAFCRQLRFPLTPRRAKGFAMNIDARRDAGFDSNFIAELSVHGQSKGRTPSVFFFNPFAEGFITHGQGFTPTAHQTALARDLANLPQFLARQDDIVIVPRRPSVEFRQTLQQAGFPLPEFVEMDGPPEKRASSRVTRSPSPPSDGGEGRGEEGRFHELHHRKLGSLRPWAWAPDSIALLEPLSPCVTGEARTATHHYNPRVAELYSKAWSAAFLHRFRAAHQAEPWLCTCDEVGVAVHSPAEALAAISAIRARGHHRIVVKQALGLAGSNAIRLWEPALLDTQRRWMEAAFGRGETLVVEPWLERLRDFSVQLEMTRRGLELRGHTGLINDVRGQFIANTVAPQSRRVPAEVAAAFPNSARIAPRLHALYAELFALLGDELHRADYLGPLGLDAFVYRAGDEQPRLKPLVEINPRYTMGRLALELMTRAAPGCHGLLQLINRAQLRAAGFKDFLAYARALRDRFPIKLAGEPVPKIYEGVVCLNDPAEARVVLAVFRVSPSPFSGTSLLD